ncbi:MAG TPA: 5-(carboxyamino)imidazole ribonucleotide synthase [Candidatus Obscuribacterales bacterium]
MTRVGVIGGGQLAWMMAGAAETLGVELVVQTPHKTDPAVAIASSTILAPIDDATATAQMAAQCDVITFENEFIDLEALMPLAQQGVCFRPPLTALEPLLDKYNQRCYLQDLGLPVPKFFALEADNPESKIEQLGFPVVIKARRHGYDGQGTFIIKDKDALEATLQQLGETPVLVEEFIPFERELAAIASRSLAGEVVVYPVVETQQEDQVCRRVLVPADISPEVTAEIEAISRKLLDSLQVVGLFGIELFLTSSGKVLVNEVSPRTHNSGHFTLDASHTDQFEQHLRAVCGLPLGNPALTCGGAVMVNLLGYEYSQNDYLGKRQQLAQLPQSHVHWYGKTESRPGRKLGHVTVLLETPDRSTAQALAQKVESIWYG